MSVKLENITYTYGQGTAFEKRALDHVNLTIESGEFLGVIGHTGSGKSTLIQQINGLLEPTEGQVYVDGEAIFNTDIKLKDIRQKVGLVFQYPEHQLFEMTIYKDVAFGPTNMGLDKAEVDQRVRWALDIVDIEEEMYEASPFDLSGGQKRRVAIAGVLAMKPDVLILDEPTAGLDPKGRDEILSEVSKLHDMLKITVILVSHSMEDIAKYVHRVVVMDKGKVGLDGSPKEVFRYVEQLEKMGLAVPQTTYLAKALKAKGFDLSQDLVTVEETRDALLKMLRKGKGDGNDYRYYHRPILHSRLGPPQT